MTNAAAIISTPFDVDTLRAKAKEMFPFSPELAQQTYHWLAADEIERLRLALAQIRARAKFEQEQPTGLHMTCLSLIEKDANEALGDQS